MLNINGKEWNNLTESDIITFLLDCEESFYFEFKEDDVTTKKIVQEISALSNTYGGYIFIGVSDDKKIKGCKEWDEQRIHTVIHDSIVPVPVFDVKKFTIKENVIYVIKINEGSEPPYITNKGLIYERISSGSFPIKDSNKLNQLYYKKENNLKRIEKKITISPIMDNTSNIYGYIDMGFSTVFSDEEKINRIINEVKLKKIVDEIIVDYSGFNIMKFGNSIVFNLGNISAKGRAMPAHVNNFIEIMNDGSVKMRILLLNNDENNFNVNMCYAVNFICIFKAIYEHIFGKIMEEDFIYAKKYEEIKVIKQFYPTYHYEEEWDYYHEIEENEKAFQKIIKSHQEVFGIDTVVTDGRMPKVGLYTIDKGIMEKSGIEFNSKNILDCLFQSSFVWMGYVEEQDNVKRKSNQKK